MYNIALEKIKTNKYYMDKVNKRVEDVDVKRINVN